MLAISKKYQVSLGGMAFRKLKSYSQNNRIPVWWHVRVSKVHLTTGLESSDKK